MRVLMLGNKKLPDNDYRVRLGALLPEHRFMLGLPGRPDSVAPADYLKVDIGEGVKPMDAFAWLRLARWLRRNRAEIDLVHVFSTQFVLFGPPLAKLLGVPTWITVTGFGRTFVDDDLRSKALRPVYRRLLRRSFQAASRVFFQNHGDRRTAQAWFPDLAPKLEWIGSAVDLPTHLRPAPRPPGSPLRVILVSRVMPSKGVDIFVDVARRVHQQRPGAASFTLIGPESPGAEALRDDVRAAEAEGALRWRGEVTGDALHESYRQHDVILFPSRGEGMSRVMLEAGFHGLCPVASRIPANEDLIKPDGGILFDLHEPAQAAASILALADDTARLIAEARAYQSHVTANYAMKSYAKRVADALAGHPPDALSGAPLQPDPSEEAR